MSHQRRSSLRSPSHPNTISFSALRDSTSTHNNINNNASSHKRRFSVGGGILKQDASDINNNNNTEKISSAKKQKRRNVSFGGAHVRVFESNLIQNGGTPTNALLLTPSSAPPSPAASMSQAVDMIDTSSFEQEADADKENVSFIPSIVHEEEEDQQDDDNNMEMTQSHVFNIDVVNNQNNLLNTPSSSHINQLNFTQSSPLQHTQTIPRTIYGALLNSSPSSSEHETTTDLHRYLQNAGDETRQVAAMYREILAKGSNRASCGGGDVTGVMMQALTGDVTAELQQLQQQYQGQDNNNDEEEEMEFTRMHTSHIELPVHSVSRKSIVPPSPSASTSFPDESTSESAADETMDFTKCFNAPIIVAQSSLSPLKFGVSGGGSVMNEPVTVVQDEEEDGEEEAMEMTRCITSAIILPGQQQQQQAQQQQPSVAAKRASLAPQQTTITEEDEEDDGMEMTRCIPSAIIMPSQMQLEKEKEAAAAAAAAEKERVRLQQQQQQQLMLQQQQQQQQQQQEAQQRQQLALKQQQQEQQQRAAAAAAQAQALAQEQQRLAAEQARLLAQAQAEAQAAERQRLMEEQAAAAKVAAEQEQERLRLVAQAEAEALVAAEFAKRRQEEEEALIAEAEAEAAAIRLTHNLGVLSAQKNTELCLTRVSNDLKLLSSTISFTILYLTHTGMKFDFPQGGFDLTVEWEKDGGKVKGCWVKLGRKYGGGEVVASTASASSDSMSDDSSSSLLLDPPTTSSFYNTLFTSASFQSRLNLILSAIRTNKDVATILPYVIHHMNLLSIIYQELSEVRKSHTVILGEDGSVEVSINNVKRLSQVIVKWDFTTLSGVWKISLISTINTDVTEAHIQEEWMNISKQKAYSKLQTMTQKIVQWISKMKQ